MNAPGPGDDAVARHALLVHAEVPSGVHDEPVHLRKRALVEQELEPLVRRLLAGLVLAGNPLDAAAQQGGLVAPTEVFEAVLEGHALGAPHGMRRLR